MTRETAEKVLATILCCLLVGGGAALLNSVGASPTRLFVAPAAPERPPQVDALVARLKTSPLLQRLDQKRAWCGGVLNKRHPPRNSCSYRPGGVDVSIAWDRKSGRRIDLTIEKSVPRGAMPFAWADLATTIGLLCSEIAPEQATAIAGEIADNMLRADWRTSSGEVVTAGVDGATRSITVRHGETCVLGLSELDDRQAVRARLHAGPFRPD